MPLDKKNTLTLLQHFLELKNRIIFSLVFFMISFIICYIFSDKIYQFLLQPFIDASQDNENRKLIYTSPTEAFTTYLKLAFSSALFVSFSIFIAELYLFLSPALYKKEKKNILFIFFFSPILFLCGAVFSYYFILPVAFKFFLGFESQGISASSLPILLETKISEYLSFITKLLFGFGVAFQLPILLLFLIKLEFLSVNDLRKRRGYCFVGIFLISAVLTPPDILSQVSLAIPMILLFEIAILIGRNFKPH